MQLKELLRNHMLKVKVRRQRREEEEVEGVEGSQQLKNMRVKKKKRIAGLHR